MPSHPEILPIDLARFALEGNDKQQEHNRLKKEILRIPSPEMDEKIHRLFKEVSSKIDCTQCGNCCKKLNPAIVGEEIEGLSKLKGLESDQFIEDYLIHKPNQGYYFMAESPCTFLEGKKCSIYSGRPVSCEDYPHLQQVDQKYRFGRTLIQYSVCPIVYHVVEKFKVEIQFEPGV